MKRIKDTFLTSLERVVPLAGKLVLEIGCGDGTRSEEIAKRCRHLIGVDPNANDIALAKERKIPNASFRQGSAEAPGFPVASGSNEFDLVIYTLSFHHVPVALMRQAIDKALLAVSPRGYIVFFEPGMEGSLFDAEIHFGAYDGDEREAKRSAQTAMKTHPRLALMQEIPDESVFQFDSLQDFMESMSPKQNLEEVEGFLEKHNYILHAARKISVFQPNF